MLDEVDVDVSTLSVVLDPPVALPAVPVPGTEPGAAGSGLRIWLPSAPGLGAIGPVGELVLDERPSWLGISSGVVLGAVPGAPGAVLVESLRMLGSLAVPVVERVVVE